MCVCVCVCVCVCACVLACVRTHECVYVSMYICVCLLERVCTCMCKRLFYERFSVFYVPFCNILN